MTGDWRTEFRRRLLEFLARAGMPLRQEGDSYWDSYLGRYADDYAEVRACGLDADASRYEDVVWTEFAGTFADPERHSGIDLFATCRCGQLRGADSRDNGAGVVEMPLTFTCGVCGFQGTPLSVCLKRGHGRHHSWCCPEKKQVESVRERS